MLHRYGEFVVRRARLLLVISGVLLVAAAVFGAGAFGELKNGGFDDPAAQSSRAQQLIDQNYGGQTNLVLLVTAKTGTVDDAATAAAGRQLASTLSGEPDVTSVVSYWTAGVPSLKSTDGTQAIVLGHIKGDPGQVVTRAKDIIAKVTVDKPEFTVLAGGQAGTGLDVTDQVTTSLAIAEAIAVPVILVLLVFVFGSVVSALLPLAIGAVAIMGTFAELAFLGSITDVSVFAVNLTTALGLGLGIDYALFIVSRFREQLAAGDDVPEAVARTVATAGRTIIFSAGTVAAALAALLVFPQYFLRSFAYAGIGVVAIAALAALVMAPAMLAVLGHRVNAGKLPWSKKVPGGESARWGRLAALAMRRPAMTALPVIALMLLAASPLLGVSFGTPDQGVLRSSADSRQVADTLVAKFPGNASSPIDVVVTGAVPAGPLATYAETLSQLPGVVRVDSSAGTFAHGQAGPANPANATLGRPDGQRLTVVSDRVTKSIAAQDLVRTVRDVPAPDGTTVLVGGADAVVIDTTHSIGTKLPLAALLVILTTFVVLFLFTGSVVQPIRALILNALSLSATIGILTWVFQDGHLSGLLGFTPRPMDTSMTVLLFCITFGLSMDYEVFLLSRIREEYVRTGDNGLAVADGLAATARVITAAALIMITVFLSFVLGPELIIKQIGLGLAAAILVDATLIRMVLVPATMELLGKANWWLPAWLNRILPNVGFEGADEEFDLDREMEQLTAQAAKGDR
jgi:RND superfamily putative drug exporter